MLYYYTLWIKIFKFRYKNVQTDICRLKEWQKNETRTKTKTKIKTKIKSNFRYTFRDLMLK